LIAVIMAGGKSSRMGYGIEKPLLKLGRETLLERTVAAIRNSRAGDIVVATTPATPKTGEFAIEKGLAVLETPGNDYHEDVYFLLDKFGPYLSVNADIPFIDEKAINLLLSKAKKKSIACVIPRASVSYPFSDDSTGKGEDGVEYIWIGLNFVTSSPDTDILVMDNELLAININTPLDLALAAKMLCERKDEGRGNPL
jgi:adenosylcobinamide-phosphate guanylyltransferase